MAGAAAAGLAAAVSEAGGLGMIGANPRKGPDWLRRQIRSVRERTRRPFGVGLITSAPHLDELLRVTIEEGVPSVSHSFADPTPYVAAAHDAGITVLAQVQKVSHAGKAARAGVDIIAAQGTGAGGHTGYSATLSLVPAVIDVAGDIPVVAAGGIADGRGLAAVLLLGAEGAWLGTRFVASHEAITADWKKEGLIQSGTDDTILTRTYDIIGNAPFPRDISNRVLRNDFTDWWHGRDEDIAARRDELMEQVETAEQHEDAGIAQIHAGNATGLISQVEPAASIVRRIIEEAEAILRDRPQELLRE